ncbi:REP-associated tyrosine transposase [Microbulbifer taiwanensis]|uniref:Transposase n=1 Tax=Microbulbifer taiwanensis TaxID=986746 RepID=A0ABW1YLC4_9GAMM|nr:transposase [Microbulbifer taiwanensis]
MARKAEGHRLRLGRHSESNCIYLVTAVCFRRQKVFSNFWLGRSFVHALMAVEDSAATLCYVVMPDHIHWLVQLSELADLSSRVQKVKSLTTKALRGHRVGPVWQRGFHDHALRREEDLKSVARYVVANPLRAGLVTSLRDYPLWDAVWL